MASPRDPRELEALPEFEELEPSPALRARVLASVEPATRLEGFLARFAALFDLEETRAREVLAVAEAPETPAWETTPLPGLRLFHFKGGPRVATADCGLVHLAAGTVFPHHRHLGLEWNFILSGSAEESDGSLWQPGDLVIRETDSVHGYRALEGAPLLFAVVLEAGLEILTAPPAPG
jgi:anti-sigma factor ChrR (cupin superfamily)